MKPFKKLFRWALLLATITNVAQVPKPLLAQKITSVEGITEYRLSNGLKVLLFPDPSKQTITVNITYLVGSRNENYGETGMAHLLEHLVFKGTPKHPNIPQELTSHGCWPNGTTWLDRTNYFETFNATDENLKWALDLESDRMINSFIAKKDLESEMTVVRNEFESGENSPNRILQERVISTAFLWHNYGNSTIGARSDIEKVPIKRLQAFYKNYYQPDNAVLLVAGKFDETKTLSLINQKFGVLPKPTRVIQQTYTEEPTQDGERSVTLRRVGDVQSMAAVYHIPNGFHNDMPPVDILTDLLTDEPSGKLYKALVEPKKASFQFGYVFSNKEPGIAYFGADVLKEKSIDSAKNILLETIETYGQTLPTKEEVERIKTKRLKGIDLALNSSDRVGLNMSEFIAMGDWRLFFYLRDELKKITPEDIQRVAQKYFKPSNRTLGLFYPTPKPDRSEIPAVPDLAAILKDYKGNELVAQGEVFDPTPANIDSKTIIADAGGMKLALLPKKTRGGSVYGRMTFYFGDEKSLFGKAKAADYVNSLLMKGTTKHTRQQIQDEFDKLKAQVYVYGDISETVVVIETIKDNLSAVIKLVAEVLREPAFPADEFEKLRQAILANIESQKSEPQSKAFEALNQHTNRYPKGDARYRPTLDEDIADNKNLKLEEITKFYKDFYGASNSYASFIGDFDEKEIKNLMAQLFGDWKSPKEFKRIIKPYADLQTINKSIEAPDKANAFFIGFFPIKLNQQDPDYPALEFSNFLLGGGFLNSRLATRIRQKEGISYGVGSQMIVSPLDDNSAFFAYAIYAPENAEKLETVFKEEIAKIVKEGFTATEIAEAKKGYLQSKSVARSQDNSLASTLCTNLFLHRTMAWDADFEKKVQALTPEQILAVNKKYFDPAKITIIKAGDFAKKKKEASGGNEKK